jgi:hypothetical protein
MIYDSASLYIESAINLAAKVLAVDAIITALFLMAAKGAESGNISEYSLDDGQTKIRTAYRDMADVERSIHAFERLKQTYPNQLNGRGMRLVDSKNFSR